MTTSSGGRPNPSRRKTMPGSWPLLPSRIRKSPSRFWWNTEGTAAPPRPPWPRRWSKNILRIRKERNSMELVEGAKAPAFEGKDQNGKKHLLDDYRGQWLLLYFYPKDDTPGCTKEACTLRDRFEDLKDKAQVVGVSHDKVESHAKFADKFKLPFTLLSDPEKKIIGDYGAKGFFFTTRISYLIDPKGRIAKIYRSVSPRNHAGGVLKDLEQFQSKEGRASTMQPPLFTEI